MKQNLIASLAAAFLMTFAAPAAFAQDAAPVELKGEVKLDKVVVENGKERHVLTEPKVVVPGDRLVFGTTYRNVSGKPVKDFVVTNPLPAGVMLAPEGAEAQTVSVDGGKTWGRLVALTVADGNGGRRSASAADVTHLRWTLAEIAPGASGSLTYDAIVR